MERKFRITKAKRANSVQEYIGRTITMKEDGTILRPDIGRPCDGEAFSMYENDYDYVNEYYEIEEITEPRIEFKCVGFEEGDMFKFKGLAKVYKVENGVLFCDSISGGWSQSIMDSGRINGAEIELLPQPIEEDKQIAELKETIEEDMRKIEEIEKARKCNGNQ